MSILIPFCLQYSSSFLFTAILSSLVVIALIAASSLSSFVPAPSTALITKSTTAWTLFSSLIALLAASEAFNSFTSPSHISPLKYSSRDSPCAFLIILSTSAITRRAFALSTSALPVGFGAFIIAIPRLTSSQSVPAPSPPSRITLAAILAWALFASCPCNVPFCIHF